MKAINDQDMAIHDAIIHAASPRERMVVAEVLCDAREAFARLYEVVALDNTDNLLENAQTIVREAQRLVTTMHEGVGENVGENE